MWLFCLSITAAAQFTTVTGTVTDPNSLPYANGTITATLVTTATPTLGGLPYTPPSGPTGLDGTGSFTIRLADNNLLLPAATTWRFHVCSAAGTVQPVIGVGPVCFDVTSITIAGASQSISVQLTAAALALTVPIGGGGGANIRVNGGPNLGSPVNFQNGTNTTVTNPFGNNVQIDVPSTLADPGSNGPIKRTALNVTGPALAADIIGLWTGGAVCDITTFLRGDGQCAIPPGGGGGAPGGADKQLQVNNATAFGGIANAAAGSWLASAGTSAFPVFQTKTVIDVRDYYAGNGVKCDGGSHPLSGFYGSLAAAQAVYPFITALSQQLDYAAAKAAANVAFGADGSEHGTNTKFNVPLLFPAGTCNFGADELLIRNADGIQINGAGKTATILTSSNATATVGFDGLWYSRIGDMSVTTTSATGIPMDVDGNVPGHPYGTRSVQGNRFSDIYIQAGPSNTFGIALCRLGSNAQCSENTFLNFHLIAQGGTAVLFYINGQNALDNVWIGGDCQGYTGDCVYLNGSTLREIGVSFEVANICTQVINSNYDIHAVGGTAATIVAIGSRTQGMQFLTTGSQFMYVAGFADVPSTATWQANHVVPLNEGVIQQSVDGNFRLYCVTTSGQTGASQPTWPNSGIVTDNAAVWTQETAYAVNGRGYYDFASSSINASNLINITGNQEYRWGDAGWLSGFYNSMYVGIGSSVSEMYYKNSGAVIDIYANSSGLDTASHFNPGTLLPKSSAGLVAQTRLLPITMASTILFTEAAESFAATPTITGCGTISSQKGSLSGSFVTSATSCTPVITGLPPAINGYACLLWDQTTPTLPVGNVSTNGTSATFGNLITTASDVIVYQCGLSY